MEDVTRSDPAIIDGHFKGIEFMDRPAPIGVFDPGMLPCQEMYHSDRLSGERRLES